MRNKTSKATICFFMTFLFWQSLFLTGCNLFSSMPVKYFNLKNDFDEQTLYNFFSNQTLLKDAKKYFSVKESSTQKLKAKEVLIKLASEGKKEKLKRVFDQFSATSPPSIPVVAAEGKFKGENAFFLVEIWALRKEKNFKWVRIWVFQEENLQLLYALSFKNPF